MSFKVRVRWNNFLSYLKQTYNKKPTFEIINFNVFIWQRHWQHKREVGYENHRGDIKTCLIFLHLPLHHLPFLLLTFKLQPLKIFKKLGTNYKEKRSSPEVINLCPIETFLRHDWIVVATIAGHF